MIQSFNLHQAFLPGMLISLKDRYWVFSENKSGYGRFDVSDPFRNETKYTILQAALHQTVDRQLPPDQQSHLPSPKTFSNDSSGSLQ